MKKQSTLSMSVTARQKRKSLSEHKRAFLNHNNPNGFPEEPDPASEETVSNVLLELLEYPILSERTVRDAARRIRKLTNKAIVIGHAYLHVARTLGYRTWGEAKYSMEDNGGYLKNLMYKSPEAVPGTLHAPVEFKSIVGDQDENTCVVCDRGPKDGVRLTLVRRRWYCKDHVPTILTQRELHERKKHDQTQLSKNDD